MTENLPKKRFRAYLGLGSNLGDREEYLDRARKELARHPQIKVTRNSSLYETEPAGYLEQGWFLNQVVEIETDLQPLELLEVMQGVENRLGRKREIRGGPRTIDVDLLLFENLGFSTFELTIPHPRMYGRNFVLVPLSEIAPHFVHPDGKTTVEHLKELSDRFSGGKIRLFQEATL